MLACYTVVASMFNNLVTVIVEMGCHLCKTVLLLPGYVTTLTRDLITRDNLMSD